MKSRRPASWLVSVVIGAGVLVGAAAPAAALGPCNVSNTATLATVLTLSACDPIVVGAGSYTGPFIVDRSVTITGPNASVSPNGGARGAEATISSASDGLVLTIPGINVTASGLSFSVSQEGSPPPPAPPL